MNLRSVFAVGLLLWSIPTFAAPVGENRSIASRMWAFLSHFGAPQNNSSSESSRPAATQATSPSTDDNSSSASSLPAATQTISSSIGAAKPTDWSSLSQDVKTRVLYPMLSGHQLNQVGHLSKLHRSALKEGCSAGTYVNLRFSKISDKKFTALFTGDGPLSQVKRLSLAYSEFNHDLLHLLPHSLLELNLRSTNLEDKGIEKLVHLKNLQVLDVSGNGLGPAAAQFISKNLKALRALDISQNQLGDNGAQAISDLVNLHTLNVSWNSLTNLTAFSTLKGLLSLTIAYNRIDADGAQAFLELQSPLPLLTLDISWNDLGDEGALAISTLKSLQTLDISRNKIGFEGAQAISSLESLQTLDISDNKIGFEGAQAISTLKFLQNLNVRNIKIDSDEPALTILNFNPLVNAFARNPNFKLFEHRGNGVRIAQAISHLKSPLHTLDISENTIGDEGALAISRLESLRKLSVHDNRIGDKGAQAISNLKSLRYLDIDKNQLTYWGGQSILNLEFLHTLSIRDNWLVERIYRHKFKSKLKFLHTLDIGDRD